MELQHKMKLNTSLFIFAFAAILFLGIASAAVSVVNSAPQNVTHTQGSFPIQVNVTNSGTDPVTLTFSGSVSTPTSSSYSLVFPQSSYTISNGTTISGITATVSFPSQQTGSFTGTINATNSSGSVLATSSISPVSILSNASLSITAGTLSMRQNSTTVNVTNTGNVDLSSITLSAPSSFSLSSSSIPSLLIGRTQQVTLSALDLSGLVFGGNTITVSANNTLASASYSFTVSKTFCALGSTPSSTANLSISSVSIDTTGDNRDTWKPLDKITVSVDARNDADTTVRGVWVYLGLIDVSTGKNVIRDLDFVSTSNEDQVEIGSISKNSDETATFDFTVPADFNTGDYRLVAKVFSKTEGEAVECSDTSDNFDQSTYQAISVETQTDDGKYIAFDKIKTVPSEVTCGDTVGLTFDTLNVGQNDEPRVKVSLYNKDLKLDVSSEIKTTFNQGDKKSMSFSFAIPAGVKDGTYNLELSSEYDYRSDTYRKQSADVVKVPIKVIGCTPVSTKLATISAVLDSEAVAGSDLIVRSTVQNVGTDTNTFTISATGYSDWATLSSISGNVLSLAPGDSRDVIIKLKVNSDAQGAKAFTITSVPASGNTVDSKEVTVNLASNSSGFSLNMGGNGILWIIGIVNVILIIIIIIVAVRVSRR